MTVVATDQGIPRKSATAQVQVNVLRNAYQPRFNRQQYTTTISENFKYGQVVLSLRATDDDNIAQPNVRV